MAKLPAASDRSGRLLWALPLGWILLNLLQAAFTELAHDEAYYWVWSRDLDWGYYDHAPLIAVLIKAGYALIPSELGVRLFPVLLGGMMLHLLLRLTPQRERPVLSWLLVSMAALHIAGFLAVPDAPLSFAVVLFLVQYRRWLARNDWPQTLLLALCAALVAYSKYQGIAFIGLLALSEPKRLLDLKLWVTGLLALAMYLPHILWLKAHNWGTFAFHLMERGEGGFNPEMGLNFVIGQLAFIGPLSSLLILWGAFSLTRTDPFYRNLKRTLLLFFGLLFFLSLFNRVEANWPAPAYPALVFLAATYWSDRPDWHRRIRIIVGLNLLLIAAMRFVLVFDVLPAKVQVFRSEFHGWPEWAGEIHRRAEGAPVLFHNSYQFPSKYAFYSGDQAYAVRDMHYRENYYTLHHVDKALQGKKVLFVAGWQLIHEVTPLQTANGKQFWTGFVEDYRSFGEVRVEPEKEDLRFAAGSQAPLPIRIIPPAGGADLRAAKDVRLAYTWKKKKELHDLTITPLSLHHKYLSAPLDTVMNLQLPTEPGDYALYITLFTNRTVLSDNSGPIRLEVTAH